MNSTIVQLMLTAGGAFLIVAFIVPIFISYFQKKKMGQVTREEGPQWHEQKSGTPTMGGIAFICAAVLVSFISIWVYGAWTTSYFSILTVFAAFATIGFIDDFLKVFRQHNLGLTSKQKFVAQIVASLLFIGIKWMDGGDLNVYIPFLSVVGIPLSAVFAIVWLTGFSNAVNLTDGLDGLATSTNIIAYATYAFIAYMTGLLEVSLFCVAVVGGLVGFLLYNKKPAKIFMGDVGSLALGAGLAAVSLELQFEWSLLTIGIVFVMETASVMLQVASFKLTGKRLFKMSPIHHHFEMLGWSEWKVVIVFSAVGLIGALLTISMFWL